MNEVEGIRLDGVSSTQERDPGIEGVFDRRD